METYKLVNGNIVTENTLGAKSPVVKLIKAEIEELKGRKQELQATIDDKEARKTEIQDRIDYLKSFLTSIGE